MSYPAELIHARYGEIPFNIDIEWNNTLDTLLSHRSVRAYQNRPLPSGTLELLVASAIGCRYLLKSSNVECGSGRKSRA